MCPNKTTGFYISEKNTTRKHNALDRRLTDHISLTLNLDLQYPENHGYDLLTCKSSRSTVSRLKR